MNKFFNAFKKRKLKRSILFVLLFFFSCLSIKAEEYEFKEKFKMTFSYTENVQEQFIMNIKETDDGFLGLKYELSGGKEIVKFNTQGEEVYTKSFEENVELSDLHQTSAGKILVTANEQKIYIYDPINDTFSSINSDSIGHPSGHSIFELDENYIVVGTVQATKENYSEYTIVLQLLDENGKELSNTQITQTRNSKCTENAGAFNGVGTSGSLCGSYYGAYSDGEKLYLFTSIAEEFAILEVNPDLTYTKRILTTSLSDDALTKVAQGVYTEFIKQEENMYFATTYGLYKIDENNVLTQPIIAEDYQLDFTSIIEKNGYLIAGGIEKSQDYPRAWVTIFDEDFNIIKSINIHDYFEISSSEKLSIVKGLSETENGFIVGGMLSATPIAIEFATKYNITTKTDGNGTILVNLNSTYAEEEVEFTVQANEGYQVDYFKVTDSNGNEIKVENNKFTMPNADVVIEAVFKADILTNPSTSDKIIFITIVIGISILFLLKYQKKLSNS